MIKFLIQVNSLGIPTTDAGYACAEAVLFRQRYDPNIRDVQCFLVRDNETCVLDADGSVIVPVGSIEFAEQFLSAPIRPINVPPQLQTLKFAGRHISEGDADDYAAFCKRFGIDHAFIKSMERCKDDQTNKHFHSGLIKGQFSTPLPQIDAEWRVFVNGGIIVDCRPYAWEGRIPRSPNEDSVWEMVDAYTASPPAYTLDVAVCGNKTFVVECHNFISCGLYGFDRHDCLFQMLVDAWKFEKLREENPKNHARCAAKRLSVATRRRTPSAPHVP